MNFKLIKEAAALLRKIAKLQREAVILGVNGSNLVELFKHHTVWDESAQVFVQRAFGYFDADAIPLINDLQDLMLDTENGTYTKIEETHYGNNELCGMIYHEYTRHEKDTETAKPKTQKDDATKA